MPYASEKQRRFMYSQHPEIADKWEKEGKNKIEDKKETSSHEHKEMVMARLKKKKK